MKKIIKKLKMLSKKQKLLVSFIVLVIVCVGTISTIGAMSYFNSKQDKVSDTSLSSDKNNNKTKKKDTSEDKKSVQEKTDSEKQTNVNENNSLDQSQNTVNQSNNQSVNTNVSNGSVTPPPVQEQTPPAQVCTGVYLDQSSVGNSGLVFYSSNEYYAWANDVFQNNGEKLWNLYGKTGFEGYSANAVDSCGNQVGVDWWTVEWY